jgi:hypothetical protein
MKYFNHVEEFYKTFMKLLMDFHGALKISINAISKKLLKSRKYKKYKIINASLLSYSYRFGHVKKN